MGRSSANAYKTGARPYGQPSASKSFRDSSPRPQGVGPSRNVQRIPSMNTATVEPSPETPRCSSLTRKGDPCKGRPPAGSDLCNFHRK
mgnify:CR=1 FL=1